MAANNGRPPKVSTSQLVGQLAQEFALFRQSSSIHSENRNKQLENIEKTLAEDHVRIARQFESVNQNLTALMVADGKLRSDLEQFVLKHEAPKLLVRLEQAEAKILALESRNARQDGAALAVKIVFALLGFLGGLAVKYL
jgi:hypothetical protein